MILGAGVVEGRQDWISNVTIFFFFFFFFFTKTVHFCRKEFKSFWVIEVSF